MLPVANLVLVHRNVRDRGTCHRCCRCIARLRQGVPGGKSDGTAPQGEKYLPARLMTVPVSCSQSLSRADLEKLEHWLGSRLRFFCLPQAGAQLQVFDGDAAEGNSTNLATAMCLPDAANWWKAISLPGQLFRCAGYSQPQKNKSQCKLDPPQEVKWLKNRK